MAFDMVVVVVEEERGGRAWRKRVWRKSVEEKSVEEERGGAWLAIVRKVQK